MRRPRFNGGRGVALLAGAAYCAVRALAYLPIGGAPSELPGGLQLISSFIPIGVWGGIWLVAAVMCVASSFARRDDMAWGLLAGMMTVWGLAYLSGFIVSLSSPEGPSREWLNASTYLGPAVMVGILSSRLLGPKDEVTSHGGS